MNKSSVVGKILIEGTLILKSPLLIGDGAGETADNFRDVHVLRNLDDKPFIPGTSLCGVLRDWLTRTKPDAVTEIFGNLDAMQSSIQTDDIELVDFDIIARDGVRLDDVTGTVDGDGKFDFEAVERGAHGSLRLVITLRACHSVERILKAVALMLKKMQDGIQLGALTTKGFGLTTVENLNAGFYDFRKKANVVAWLLDKPAVKKIFPSTEENDATPNDFVVDALFKFNSSFIVRDYDVSTKKKKSSADEENAPAVVAVALKSRKDFVIPGTSLKGILRHRAEYIFAKLGLDPKTLDGLMGSSTTDKKIKSRFIVAESYIAPENFSEVEHCRNKIDRFTGGVIQGMLFATKPAYQKNLEPTFKLHFEIRNAVAAEAGLALFLLRDLWLGRVALGGEKSVGRGTVSGVSAEIKFKGETYKLDANGKVICGEKSELESFAAALKNFAGGDEK